MRHPLGRATRIACCSMLVLVSALIPTAAAATTGTAVPAASGGRGPVVLIGTGGLRWGDVSADQPAISALEASGASGLLAVRSVRDLSCPIDGWLAVSAGKRAADTPTSQRGPHPEPACRQPTLTVPTAGGPATVPRWGSYLAEARSGSFDAKPGLLGDTLAAHHLTAVAVGPGAAIALADGSGQVAHAYSGTVDGAAGNVDPSLLGNDVQAALKQSPDLLVIDLGSIRDPAQRLPGEPKLTGSYASDRETQVTRLDDRLGLVTGALPANATVILASLADSGPPVRMRLVAATGPAPGSGGKTASYSTGLLRSDSTRQDGVVQTTDLMPTLLAALGVRRPADAVGAPLRPVRVGSALPWRVQHMADLDQAANEIDAVAVPFFVSLIAAQALVYLIAYLLLRRRRIGGGRGGEPGDPIFAQKRRSGLSWLAGTAVVFSLAPAASFLANLVPWWRATRPTLVCCLLIAAITALLGLLVLFGPWRRLPLGTVAAAGTVNALVLIGDVLTGSKLSLACVFGGQPIIAGRFYGFSNPQFAVLATGLLLLAVGVADQLRRAGRDRDAALAVAGIGVLATVVDGAPWLGSDFGGPPALIPAFGVLALLVAGIRITWRRAGLIALGTLAALVLLSLADWLRPADSRTHVGRFVQTVLDGGAGTVIHRKAAQNLGILFSSWLVALLPVAIVLVALVLFRPGWFRFRALLVTYQRLPLVRWAVGAWALLVLIGFALNDSGTSIPPAGGLVLLPLLVAISARALADDDAERLLAVLARARRSKSRR